MTSPKVLILDIETLPNITYAFDLFSYKRPHMIIKERSIISFAYKWLGDKKAKVITYHDCGDKTYEDKKLCKAICDILKDADYTVAHYGDKFDHRFIRARCIINGVNPPAPTLQIDTYKLAKKHFNLNANRLDYLGKLFGFGGKMPMSWDFWERCANGDLDAVATMAKYNKRDVDLLEKVFVRMLPHVESRINHKLFTHKHEIVCPSCSSHKLQKRGTLVNKATKRQRYQCNDCGSWSVGTIIHEK